MKMPVIEASFSELVDDNPYQPLWRCAHIKFTAANFNMVLEMIPHLAWISHTSSDIEASN